MKLIPFKNLKADMVVTNFTRKITALVISVEHKRNKTYAVLKKKTGKKVTVTGASESQIYVIGYYKRPAVKNNPHVIRGREIDVVRKFDPFERRSIYNLIKEGFSLEKAINVYMGGISGISEMSPALQQYCHKNKMWVPNPRHEIDRDPYSPMNTAGTRYHIVQRKDGDYEIIVTVNGKPSYKAGGRYRSYQAADHDAKIWFLTKKNPGIKKNPGKVAITYRKEKILLERTSGININIYINGRYYGSEQGYAAAIRESKKFINSGHIPRNRKNPVTIYPQIDSISAMKNRGAFAGRYRHKFNSPASVIGMPDGSLKIKSSAGNRLWGTYKYGKDGKGKLITPSTTGKSRGK